MNDGIDIINDKSFIIAPPTTYKLLNKTVASYEYIGGKIKEFPKFLLDRYSDKKVVNTKTSKPKNSTNKIVEIVEPVKEPEIETETEQAPEPEPEQEPEQAPINRRRYRIRDPKKETKSKNRKAIRTT